MAEIKILINGEEVKESKKVDKSIRKMTKPQKNGYLDFYKV